jgi:hypothetical protein
MAPQYVNPFPVREAPYQARGVLSFGPSGTVCVYVGLSRPVEVEWETINIPALADLGIWVKAKKRIHPRRGLCGHRRSMLRIAEGWSLVGAPLLHKLMDNV